MSDSFDCHFLLFSLDYFSKNSSGVLWKLNWLLEGVQYCCLQTVFEAIESEYCLLNEIVDEIFRIFSDSLFDMLGTACAVFSLQKPNEVENKNKNFENSMFFWPFLLFLFLSEAIKSTRHWETKFDWGKFHSSTMIAELDLLNFNFKLIQFFLNV